jgi:hypothetical protein
MLARLCEHAFVGDAGTAFGRFRHAIARGNLSPLSQPRASSAG